MALGLLLMTGGMLWYSQIPVDGSYASDLLPGYLMVGVGIAFAFVPVSIAALAGIAEREAGLASGLINTSQQIGGAVGVAVASTVFISHSNTLAAEGTPGRAALTGGYQWAFWTLAFIGVASAVAALLLIRREELTEAPTTAPIAG
jgi:MFS family permease